MRSQIERRTMVINVLLALLGFEIKHFLADYMLQAGWMVTQKGDFRRAGGYAHAGLHVLFSAIVMVFVVPVNLSLAAVLLAEFVVHYAIDYAKVHGSKDVKIGEKPQLFWALHGFDQLLHQLTYLAMATYVAFATAPAVGA